MLDPLGALVITFMVMSVISVIGVAMLFLVKNSKIQKRIFYFLTLWGMVIAYCNVRSTPELWTGSILLAWGIGALSVVALLMQLCSKKENSAKISRILAAVSVVAGMIDCFLI